MTEALTRQAGLAPIVEMMLGLLPSMADLRLREGLADMRNVLLLEPAGSGGLKRTEGEVRPEGAEIVGGGCAGEAVG